MRRMGERWLAEIEPFARMESEPGDTRNHLVFRRTCKALDCLLLAQVGEDLCAMFAALGMVLGSLHAQQDDELKPFLDAALERGMSSGLAQGAADHPETGRA